jgi:hypothetical protein
MINELLGALYIDEKSAGSLELNSSINKQEDKNSLSLKKDRRFSMNSVTGPEISQDDKRLLLRIKWMLTSIFPDVKPYNSMDDEDANAPMTRQSSVQSMYEGSEEDSDLDNAQEDEEDDGKNPHMSRDERRMEKKVQGIMKDPADSAELTFVLGMMSFLKDGTTKALSKRDGREWAKVLLKSVGRDTDIVNMLLPDLEDDPLTTLHNKVNDTPEMDDWRSVLVHLQTFYPVGSSVGRMANVEFEDDKNMASRGVMSRIRTMRSDLKEVVKYKVEKSSRSKTGKSLATNLTVTGELWNRIQTERVCCVVLCCVVLYCVVCTLLCYGV